MADPIITSGIFFGWTETELETELARIKAEIKLHGPDAITSYSTGGKSFAKVRAMSLTAYMSHLAEALQKLNPTDYGYRKSRTIAAHSGITEDV